MTPSKFYVETAGRRRFNVVLKLRGALLASGYTPRQIAAAGRAFVRKQQLPAGDYVDLAVGIIGYRAVVFDGEDIARVLRTFARHTRDSDGILWCHLDSPIATRLAQLRMDFFAHMCANVRPKYRK
jgi:hypothetical protein